uniref:Uncharacterized protein n=1 Tax=Ananas comosus var. bracteatus TaxID=296719 RepID=A0A6V7Q2V2_ANACO|nr:unnamed protein product [Ananas comosus var. bracteatus]
MAALVVAVNPRVKFSDEQISAILDEVFRTYAEFIRPDSGLSLDGLLRTYDDGAGDVDRDFDALSLRLDPEAAAPPSPRPPARSAPSARRAAPWAASPNHGVVFDSSWALLDDLEILVKRLRSKHLQKAATAAAATFDGGSNNNNNNNNNNNFDSFSEAGWSREMGPSDSTSSADRRFAWDETGRDYLTFLKELAVLRGRADGARSREEAFDNHMVIGRALYEHRLFRDALISFRRACELQPTDVRPHFRAGNSLYALGRHAEAKEEFLLALEAAEAGGSQSADILPQIHVNLGIAMEGEGMIGRLRALPRGGHPLLHSLPLPQAPGQCPLRVGEYRAAEKALEEAVFLRPDYADAHCDLGSTLHARDVHPGIRLPAKPLAAQLNKAVALLGQGESDEGKRALKEAFKMTQRVELYDAIVHLKTLQKKKKQKPSKESGTDGRGLFL